MLIDTHAHINFIAYKEDGGEVIKRALENNTWIINVGSQWDTSRRAVEYAKKYEEGIFAAVGLHPIHLRSIKIKEEFDEQELLEFETQEEKFDYEKYKTLASESGAIAIGETGLDYYRINEEDKENQIKLQKENFLAHIKLAQEISKPLIVHCREAHNEVLEILKSQVTSDKLQGVIHSFSGRLSQAEQYLEMGFYLGFNGIITFARDYDKVIKEIPLERILVETDCPYLTPIPFRGKRNEPLYVKYVAEKIAEIKGVSFDEVSEVTTDNARGLFYI
ncbi:MAG: TatD family hydrolase [Candidatus Portnoybacteria bacterium]|nr:TatD family hydrolase [Candidatus Portnoybacteria bacterium]